VFFPKESHHQFEAAKQCLEREFDRCTRVESPGEGLPYVFAKILKGGEGFQEKLPGGSPISGFIAFLLTSVLKFACGVLYLPSPITPCVPL
jgi:hypothetical protein